MSDLKKLSQRIENMTLDKFKSIFINLKKHISVNYLLSVRTKSWFVFLFLLYISLQLLLVIGVAIEFINDENLTWGLCLTNSCLKLVNERFIYSLSFSKELTVIFGTILAGLGVYIGWKTYALSLENSIMSNHNNNLSNFAEFCSVQIERDHLLNPERIDLYAYYALVFPDSRSGKFNFFRLYDRKLNDVKAVIEDSNQRYNDAKDTNLRYKYTNHQTKLIEVLKQFGITIEHRHRTSFDEIELSLYQYIDSVTKQFTTSKIRLAGLKKDYL